MATANIRLGSITPAALYLGSTRIRRCYLGSEMVWDEPLFVDEPKIDPAHALANRATKLRLINGALTNITVGSGTAQVVDNAFASGTAGTQVFVHTPFPAANSATFRVSALIKVDKTAGRYSRIGFCSNTVSPTTSTPDIYIGHTAGSGIQVNSTNFAISLSHTVLTEAQCVDGAWYRVSVAYDNRLDQSTADSNVGKARVTGAAEPVDPANTPANPWYPPSANSRHDSVGAGSWTPTALVARTNSALGTIKDLYYIDSMLGATSGAGEDPVDNAPILDYAKMGTGTDVADLAWIYSKGKSAPLRVIVTAGGSGVYGGVDFALGTGRSGHPYDAFRKFWRDLANLGYTVLHSKALHEGWGADDHLTKQLEALNYVKTEFGTDVRLYYLGYSMGGLSAWRAIMGRAGFPSIRAAYIVAGAAHLDDYYDIPMYSAIQTRWPDREALDEPINFSAAELVARGTRVRMVTSTGDTNVPKSYAHDPMVAKFATAPELISELVHDGIGHFDPTYWDAQDCVDFFEGADA
jgi:hypothetical protein